MSGKVPAVRSQWLLEPAGSFHWRWSASYPQWENDIGAKERMTGVAQITAHATPLSYAATR
jgi:hypothetical protein